MPVKNSSILGVDDISIGGFHTFVKTINKEIYGFGQNNYSQFGFKTESDDVLLPIQVLKDQEFLWGDTVFKSKAKSARK